MSPIMNFLVSFFAFPNMICLKEGIDTKYSLKVHCKMISESDCVSNDKERQPTWSLMNPLLQFGKIVLEVWKWTITNTITSSFLKECQ